MTPPPQDTLVSRKLMTGFARDFTGRECTEMSFVPIPPAIAPFHRIGIDLLGDFQKVCSWKQMDNSLHGLLNAICNNKSLADSRSRRNSEVLT
ncbi:hypothetical protein TNCV_4753061 [Trichonephila clavipes]|nr:hypothetical protein TNCV_4753061 [Trichonephila clavipes]